MSLETLFTHLGSSQTKDGLVLTPQSEVGTVLKGFIGLLYGQQFTIQTTEMSYDNRSTAQSIRISGTTTNVLPVHGLNCRIVLSSVTIVFSETGPNTSRYMITVRMDAVLPIASSSLTLQGTVSDDAPVNFTLKAQPTRSFSLLTVATLLSPTGDDTVTELPLRMLTDKEAPITELQITCRFDGSTSLAFSSVTLSSWTIMLNKAVFLRTQIFLNSTYLAVPGGRFRYVFNGRLEGEITIGERTYLAVLPLIEGEFMELQLLRSAGRFPTLPDLAQWVDGDDLRDITQASLAAMGLNEMSVDSVSIGFNSEMEGHPLAYVSTWTHKSLLGHRIDFFSRIAPTIGLTVSGSLVEGSTLSLAALVKDLVPEAPTFIDGTITDLVVDAYPYRGFFSVTALPANQTLQIGPFTLSGASFELEKERDEENNIVTYIALGGTIRLAGLPLVAEIIPSQTSGWEWIARAPVESTITLHTLYDAVALLFPIHHTRPADRQIKDLEVLCAQDGSWALVRYVNVENEQGEILKLALTPPHSDDEISHQGSQQPSSPDIVPPESSLSSSQEAVVGTPPHLQGSFSWDMPEGVLSSLPEWNTPTEFSFSSPFSPPSPSTPELEFDPYPLPSGAPFPDTGYLSDDDQDTVRKNKRRREESDSQRKRLRKEKS